MQSVIHTSTKHIMLRLIKLKSAININLASLDVTHNPNKHNW